MVQPARLLCPWGFSRQEYWRGWPCPPPGDLPNPGIEPRSPALQVDSLPTEPPGKSKNTEVGSLSLLQGIFWPRNWTSVSCIADGFFTSWTTREAHALEEWIPNLADHQIHRESFVDNRFQSLTLDLWTQDLCFSELSRCFWCQVKWEDRCQMPWWKRQRCT